jgi:hypothetical protein
VIDAPDFTPFVPRQTWCPECGGQPVDDLDEVACCEVHRPGLSGADDRRVADTGYLSTAEATAANCRAMQALIS